jgi:hypothetical protein
LKIWDKDKRDWVEFVLIPPGRVRVLTPVAEDDDDS